MTPPPDTAAKIAADLRDTANTLANHGNIPARVLHIIAARVEALGLKPSEREIVSRVLYSLRDKFRSNWVADEIAALAPIAEGK